MKTLFIDTHLNDIIVILLEDGVVVDKEEVINKKNNSEILFSTVVKVINNKKINEIIVVNGPGSFTSVRLGVTIAKTLAYTLNIPIKTITSLEVSAVSNDERSVAISDGNGYYIGEFNEDYTLNKDYYYVNNREVANIENFNKYVNNYNINIMKIYKFLNNKEYVNPHDVNPIYVKKIGVEIDKKSNN